MIINVTMAPIYELVVAQHGGHGHGVVVRYGLKAIGGDGMGHRRRCTGRTSTAGRRCGRRIYVYDYFLDLEQDAKKRELFEDLQNQANKWIDGLYEVVELDMREILCATDGGAAIAAELLGYYQKKVVSLTQHYEK